MASNFGRLISTCSILALLGTGQAWADSFTINGDTTGAPTYDRIFGTYPSFSYSSTGTGVAYYALTFNIDDPAGFRAEVLSFTGGDSTMTLYTGSFDPTDAMINARAYDDDGGAGLLSRIDAADGPFDPGEYVLVVTGFSPTNVGMFTLQIDGINFIFGPSDAAFVNSMIASGVAGNASQMIGSFGSRISGGNENDAMIATNGSDAPLGDTGITAWAKAEFSSTEASGDLGGIGTSGSYTEDANFIQGGFSSVFINDERGRAIASLFAHYGTSDAFVKNAAGTGTGSWESTAYGIGAALTWMDVAGWYVDAVAQYTAFDIDTTTTAGATGSTDASATAFQLSAGWKLTPFDGIAVIPQGAVTYQLINIDSYTDSLGTVASFSDNDSFEGSIGLKFATDDNSTLFNRTFKASVEANLVNEFLDGGTTTVAGTPIGFDLSGPAAEFGAGLSVTPENTGLRLWTKAKYRTPFDEGRETAAVSGGFSWSF